MGYPVPRVSTWSYQVVADPLGLGWSVPGVCVLALRTNPLHAMCCAALFIIHQDICSGRREG